MRLIICLLLLHTFCFSDEGKSSTLTVKGTAQFMKPSDELSLTLGVVTEGDTAQKALTENNLRMQKMIEYLEKAGLTSSEYKTGLFSVRPLYTQSPQNPPIYWRPSIYGYEVSNTLEIKTGQLKIAGEIIDAATRGGANKVENIRFGLQDPRTHRTEAINRATTYAFDDARALSRAANVKLNRVVSLVLDQAGSSGPVYRTMLLKGAAPEGVPLEPGDVEVTAEVTITWEVESE
jgi:uncharacterized protein YggE